MSRTRRHDPGDDEDEGEVCRRCREPLAGNEGFTVGICSDCEDEMESDEYDPDDDDFEDDDFDFDLDFDED